MSTKERTNDERALAPLGAALKAMPPPTVDEAALRRMFRAHRAAIARRPTAAQRRMRWAIAATIVCAAVGAVLGLTLLRVPTAAVPQAPVTAPADVVAAFRPLLYSPEVVPGAAYSVVRVRIPLASIALLPEGSPDGMIEADLLVGEDGLARGVRFNGAGALLVSKASPQ